MQALRRLSDKFVADLLHQRREFDGDVLLRTPADANPRIRRRELEIRIVIDDRNVVDAAERFPEFIGHRYAADAGAENDDVGHYDLPRCCYFLARRVTAQ